MNCKICYEKYDKENHKPITLMPCGHSMCTKCLIELKKQFIVICPACRNTVTCEKPNYDLIDLLDINSKTDAKTAIRRSINKELKEFKEMFKEFCAESDRITNLSITNRDSLKDLINERANEWINVIKANQNDLIIKAENMHNSLVDRVQSLMNEQMSRQLRSKNLKQMDQNELFEFKIDLNNFKTELSEKIIKIGMLECNHSLDLTDECFLNTKRIIESALSNYPTIEVVIEKEKPITLQNTMICGFVDLNVKVWNAQDGNCAANFSGHSKVVTSLIVVGNKLVTGSEDKTIKVWDIKTGSCIHTLKGHVNAIECILNVSNKAIASGAGTGDKAIKLWDLESGECVNTLLDVHKGGAFSLCLKNKLDDVLISGGGYGSIKFTNMKTGQRIKILNGHTAKVVDLKVINGESLLSCSDDKTVKLWDIENGTCTSALKFLSEYFYRSIQVTSNATLVSASDDVSIKVWNIKNGECIQTLTGHTNIVLCILLITDSILASGSWDSTIKIWDIERNICLKTLKGHTERVYNIQQISNHIILSASHDKTIRIWNILTGECLNTIEIDTNDVKYLNVLGIL